MKHLYFLLMIILYAPLTPLFLVIPGPDGNTVSRDSEIGRLAKKVLVAEILLPPILFPFFGGWSFLIALGIIDIVAWGAMFWSTMSYKGKIISFGKVRKNAHEEELN